MGYDKIPKTGVIEATSPTHPESDVSRRQHTEKQNPPHNRTRLVDGFVFSKWRRWRDSNPRQSYPCDGFQDRFLKPARTHLREWDFIMRDERPRFKPKHADDLGVNPQKLFHHVFFVNEGHQGRLQFL